MNRAGGQNTTCVPFIPDVLNEPRIWKGCPPLPTTATPQFPEEVKPLGQLIIGVAVAVGGGLWSLLRSESR